MTEPTPARKPEPDSTRANGRAPVLARLARLMVRRRRRVVLAWIAGLALIAGLSPLVAGEFEADYSAPGSESALAAEIVSERFGSAGSGDSIDVAWKAPGGAAAEPAAQRVERFLADASELEGIRAARETRISEAGTIGLAALDLDRRAWDVPLETSETLIERAEAASGEAVQIELAGGPIQEAQGGAEPEVMGLMAAMVILLIAFGSLVAAGLPLLAALLGLGISLSLISVLAAVVAVPDWSTSVAALIGIAVGIDYTLLILVRFRSALGAGRKREEAIAEALVTAGRSVLVAGTTVIVALGGLLLMRLSFMTGVAFAAGLAVLVAMIAALTLVPALLAIAGHRVDRLRIPFLGRGAWGETGAFAARWSRMVQRRPWIAAIAGTAVLLALTAPLLSLRLNFPDAGNDPQGTTTRAAHDLITEGFGPGANGPLLLTAELDDARPGAVADTGERIRGLDGVAGVGEPIPGPDGDVAILSVIPSGLPQDESTEQLVHALREDVLPAARAETGIRAHVGGMTASFVDQSELMSARMPVFIAGVLCISLLLLLLAFRAPVIALKAGVVNLLSVGAAYGVVSLAAQGGFLGQLVGIDTATPVPPFIPVIMFAILFGLSMDYEVFLLSRVREEFLRHGDTARAVTEGLARTARVITAAAAIMVAVFSGFIFANEVFLKLMGLGMAAAIAVDASIVRMVLVPAVMQILGRANWWLPGWLDRSLPAFEVEAPGRREPARAEAG